MQARAIWNVAYCHSLPTSLSCSPAPTESLLSDRQNDFFFKPQIRSCHSVQNPPTASHHAPNTTQTANPQKPGPAHLLLLILYPSPPLLWISGLNITSSETPSLSTLLNSPAPCLTPSPDGAQHPSYFHCNSDRLKYHVRLLTWPVTCTCPALIPSLEFP